MNADTRGSKERKRNRSLLRRFAPLALVTLGMSSGVAAQGKDIAIWYKTGWNQESHEEYKVNHLRFNEVNPYWYDLGTNTDGSVRERLAADGGYTPAMVKEARDRGDLVVPAIGDRTLTDAQGNELPGQINTILANPTASQNLRNQIYNIVVSRSYDGIDLNFENADNDPTTRQQFTDFVNALATTFHARNPKLRLEVTVRPALTESMERIFDFPALAAGGVDRIKIMAYDRNLDFTSTPSANAPLWWFNKIVEHARSRFTAQQLSSKVMIAINNHGFTFKQLTDGSWKIANGRGSNPPLPTCGSYPAHTGQDSFQEVECRSPNIAWTWEENMAQGLSHEHFKQYVYPAEGGSTYKSYIGTAASVSERMNQVTDFAGVAFWVSGREDPAIYQTNWPVVRARDALTYGVKFLIRSDLGGQYVRANTGNTITAADTTIVDEAVWIALKEGALSSTATIKVGDIVILKNNKTSQYIYDSETVAKQTANLATAERFKVLGYNCGCSTGDSLIPSLPDQFRIRLEAVGTLRRLKHDAGGNSLRFASGGGDSANWRLDAAP